MATRKPLFFNAAEFGSEEMAVTDDIALGGLAMSADITMGGNEVTGLPATPVGATSASSKAYVDSVAAGLSIRDSVDLATAVALPAYTAAGGGVGKTLTAVAVGVLTVDGIATVLGDHILVKNEGASHLDHGVYEVTTEGTAGVAFILTRRTDLDQDAEVFDGITVWVRTGTANGDTRWTITTNDPIVVDTTAIAWTQTAGPGILTGGDGIDITAGVISADLDTDAGLEFDLGKIQVKLDGTTLSRAIAGMAVVGLPSLFEIGGVAVGATVTAPNLDTLTDGSNADLLHAHATVSAGRLEDELTAEEALSLGDPIEWGTTNDEIRQCRASVVSRLDCFGIVEEALGISAAAIGTIVRRGVAAGVLTGATVGNRYYVANAGGLVQGIGGIAAGNHVILVGTAKNATDLEVNPQYITKKAA